MNRDREKSESTRCDIWILQSSFSSTTLCRYKTSIVIVFAIPRTTVNRKIRGCYLVEMTITEYAEIPIGSKGAREKREETVSLTPLIRHSSDRSRDKSTLTWSTYINMLLFALVATRVRRTEQRSAKSVQREDSILPLRPTGHH